MSHLFKVVVIAFISRFVSSEMQTDTAVLRLQALGFDAAESSQALIDTNGDLSAAASLLFSSREHATATSPPSAAAAVSAVSAVSAEAADTRAASASEASVRALQSCLHTCKSFFLMCVTPSVFSFDFRICHTWAPFCAHLSHLGGHSVLIGHTWGPILFSFVTLGAHFVLILSHLGPILISFVTLGAHCVLVCHTWGPFCSRFVTLGGPFAPTCPTCSLYDRISHPSVKFPMLLG